MKRIEFIKYSLLLAASPSVILSANTNISIDANCNILAPLGRACWSLFTAITNDAVKKWGTSKLIDVFDSTFSSDEKKKIEKEASAAGGITIANYYDQRSGVFITGNHNKILLPLIKGDVNKVTSIKTSQVLFFEDFTVQSNKSGVNLISNLLGPEIVGLSELAKIFERRNFFPSEICDILLPSDLTETKGRNNLSEESSYKSAYGEIKTVMIGNVIESSFEPHPSYEGSLRLSNASIKTSIEN